MQRTKTVAFHQRFVNHTFLTSLTKHRFVWDVIQCLTKHSFVRLTKKRPRPRRFVIASIHNISYIPNKTSFCLGCYSMSWP